jgi:imidazolonepropionase
MTEIAADTIITNASELITCSEKKGALEVVKNGWLAIKGERIIALGGEKDVTPFFAQGKTQLIDAAGKVVAPGFIDSHTHLVFGGSRVEEYAAKITTNDLSELEKRGIKTGILATVEDTRRSTEKELFFASMSRLNRMLAAGTTTIESKSGYGLSTKAEIKILEVNEQLRKSSPVDIITTFLGAHGWPQDTPREQYIDILINEMIPWVAELGLAQFCDIWCDQGYYSAKESEKILKTALDLGLKPKIHTDAYSYVGGSDLAAEMKMVSADHLNYTPDAAMKKLAEAGVIGVLLPALDFAVQHQRPFNYLQMKSMGMTVALATNLCPGCWTESMQFVMAIACRLYKMSPAEALLAATNGGAKALNIDQDYGSLAAGKYADIQIWDVPKYEYVIYRLGSNIVEKVLKKGSLVVDNPACKIPNLICKDGDSDE